MLERTGGEDVEGWCERKSEQRMFVTNDERTTYMPISNDEGLRCVWD